MKKSISIIVVTYNSKRDIKNCLESISNSDCNDYEIIVVDNNSTDGTVDILERDYKNKIKIIKSNKNIMGGGGRNLGAKYANGDYLLFIDSDNVIDKKMVTELVKGMKRYNAGMAGPLMYSLKDPQRIWWANSYINLWTSKTTYMGFGEIDKGQYNLVKEVGHIPNVFMIQKWIWDQLGGIDKDYVMHYEESDLAERVRKIGYKIYIIPSAKTWHNVLLLNNYDVLKLNNQVWVSMIGGKNNLMRNYYSARNRVLFMKKNANLLQYLIFLFLFLPLSTIFYLYKIIKSNNFKIAKTYLKGTVHGILFQTSVYF